MKKQAEIGLINDFLFFFFTFWIILVLILILIFPLFIIAFKEIFSVSTFKEYFVRVGFTSKSFSNSEVSLLLRRNAAKAYERKYFVSPSTPIDDYVFVL